MASRFGTQSLLTLFPALAEPLVRRYFLGQASSLLGIWVQNITLNLLAWTLTESPALLGVLNFLLWGPAVVITPLVGPYAHPEGSRRQVSWTVGGSMAVSLALMMFHAVDLLTIPLLLGLATLRGILAGIEVPGRQVLLTSSIRDRSRIGNAVAMNAIAYNGARMIGPAFAAAIYPTLGATVGFALSAVSMGVMFVIVRSMPTPVAIPGESRVAGEPRPGLRAAFDYVRRDRLASLFLPVAGCLAILGSSYQTLVPVLADRVHGSASVWTGIFFASAGAGSTVSALLLSSKYLYAASRRLQVIAPWTVVLALAGLGLSESGLMAIGCFAMLGFALTFTGPGTNAKLHQNAPAQLRGALVGLYALSFTGMIPVGNLLAGMLAQWLPVQTTLLAMSATLALCLSLLFVPRWIRHRRIVLDGDKI